MDNPEDQINLEENVSLKNVSLKNVSLKNVSLKNVKYRDNLRKRDPRANVDNSPISYNKFEIS